MFSPFSQVSEGHRQRHERPGAGQWELQSAVPPGCGPTAAGRRGGGEGGSVEGAEGWIPGLVKNCWFFWGLTKKMVVFMGFTRPGYVNS